MTTVADIINLSLKDIGLVGEGQTASGSTLDDAFATLGQMIAEWQTNRLAVYAQKTVVATLTGAATYTVGIGGAIDIARPIKIDGAFWRSGGIDYPVIVFGSLVDYERAYKGIASGMLAAICYEPTFPLGTLYALPNSAAGELHLVTRIDLPAYITAADDIAFPPEYALALRYSLAELLAPTFGAPLRADIPALATRARKVIKRNNVRIPLAQMPGALARGHGSC